jgi:hypothetical protein
VFTQECGAEVSRRQRSVHCLLSSGSPVSTMFCADAGARHTNCTRSQQVQLARGMLKASVAMGTMCSHQDGLHESFTLGESSLSALSGAENALQQLACNRDQESMEYGDESQTSAGGEGAAQADHGGPLAVAALALGDSVDLLAPPTPNGTQHNVSAMEEEEPSAAAVHSSGAGDKAEGDATLSRDVHVLGEEDDGLGRSAEAQAQDEMEVDVSGPEAANGAEDQGSSAPGLAGGGSIMAGIEDLFPEGKAESAHATLPPDAEAASKRQDDAETHTDDDQPVECKSVDEGNMSEEGQQLAGASTASAEAETGAVKDMCEEAAGNPALARGCVSFGAESGEAPAGKALEDYTTENVPEKMDSSSRAAGSFMEAAEDDQDYSQFTQPGESQFQHAAGSIDLHPKHERGLNRDSSEEGEAEGEWTRSEEELQPWIKLLLANERRKVEVMEGKLATMAEENKELVRLKDQLQRLRQDNDEAEQEVVQMKVSRAYMSTYISTLRKKHSQSFNSAHHVACDLARSEVTLEREGRWPCLEDMRVCARTLDHPRGYVSFKFI